jgi:hypothetical protein
MSATRRPWRVHVHDIGPNFSFASEEKARALAARLVSGETWDGGPTKGLLGAYSKVTVFTGLLEGGGALMRRTIYAHGKEPVHEEIGPHTFGRWERVKVEEAS